MDEVIALPFHAKQIAVLWMDWNVPIRTLNIKFGQKRTLAKGHVVAMVSTPLAFAPLRARGPRALSKQR